MKKIVILPLTALIICVSTFAQRSFFVGDQNTGKPYAVKTAETIEGNPFLFSEWKMGKVKLKNGQVFDSLKLKFDAYLNKVFYNHNDSLYEFLNEISEFEIVANAQSQPYIFHQLKAEKSFKPGTFVQVLAKGKINVVKYYLKEIEETKEYGNPMIFKKYRDRSLPYIIAGGEVYPAKYGTKLMEELTAIKFKEVDSFVKSKDLNVKKEAGFVAAIQYYNRL